MQPGGRRYAPHPAPAQCRFPATALQCSHAGALSTAGQAAARKLVPSCPRDFVQSRMSHVEARDAEQLRSSSSSITSVFVCPFKTCVRAPRKDARQSLSRRCRGHEGRRDEAEKKNPWESVPCSTRQEKQALRRVGSKQGQ